MNVSFTPALCQNTRPVTRRDVLPVAYVCAVPHVINADLIVAEPALYSCDLVRHKLLSFRQAARCCLDQMSIGN